MSTVNGISVANGPGGPVPVSPPAQPANKPEPQAPKTDSVSVSPAAAVRQSALADVSSEIRQAQVDAAKARLAEGTYKLQATVLQVASRVAAFVD